MLKKHKYKYKKYSLADRLKTVELYNQGYGCTTISMKLSVCESQIKRWIRLYKSRGVEGLSKQQYVPTSFETKKEIVKKVLKNNLSYGSVSLIYRVSESAVYSWVSKVKQGGYKSLTEIKNRGRPSRNMSRPKKKKPETELEQLQAEVEYLRAENAYLKKLRALVEERQALEKGKKPKPSNH